MLCLHVANDRAQKEPSCLCQASPVIRMFVYPFMKASPCDLNTFCKALSANTVELEVHVHGHGGTQTEQNTAFSLAW